MRKGPLAAAAAIILLGGATVAGYLYWRQTPEFALKQVAKAVSTHDRELFEKYVDVESVIDRAIDDLLAHQNARRKIDDPEKSIGEQIGEGIVQLMRPKLVEMVKRELDKAIEPTGPVADTDSPILQLLRSAALSDISRAGKLTTVSMDATLQQFDVPVQVSLTMRKEDGHQRILAIANLREILDVYEEAETQWKRKENKRPRQELNRSLIVTTVNVSRDEDQWGINKKLVIQLQVANTTEGAEIVAWAGTLHFVDPKTADVQAEVPLSAQHAGFAPLARQDLQWKLDINEFIERDARLWSLSGVIALLTVNQIEFADGKLLAVPYPDVAEISSPAFAALINEGCGRYLRDVTKEYYVFGALAYPLDSAKKGDEYEVVSELLAASGTDGLFRNELRCWGLMETDGSLTLREVRLGDSVIVPRDE